MRPLRVPALVLSTALLAQAALAEPTKPFLLPAVPFRTDDWPASTAGNR